VKEHIYTIPVNEAFQAAAAEGACPVCVMRRALEADSLDYTLGPSYMEEDTRAQTDKMGFCAEHWGKLYARQNRLGLSLIMHTHIRHILDVLDHIQVGQGMRRRGVFAKPESPLGAGLREIDGACFVCARIDRLLGRYIDNMLFMWPDTPELHKLTKECGGFCLPHLTALFSAGPGQMKERDWLSFCAEIIPIQRKTLEGLEADLDWFIKKFDYRNTGEPWGNAKDALPRALRTVGRAD